MISRLSLSLNFSMVFRITEENSRDSSTLFDDHSSSPKLVSARLRWSLLFLFHTHYPIFFGVSYLFQKTQSILFRCCSWYRRCFGGLFTCARTFLFALFNSQHHHSNNKHKERRDIIHMIPSNCENPSSAVRSTKKAYVMGWGSLSLGALATFIPLIWANDVLPQFSHQSPLISSMHLFFYIRARWRQRA